MQPRDRGLVSEPVSVDASAEEFEKLFEALPTVPGGVSVSREVSGKHQRLDRTTVPGVDHYSPIDYVGDAAASLFCLHILVAYAFMQLIFNPIGLMGSCTAKI